MSAKHLHRLEAHHYSAFDSLDGDHPWMLAMPEGFVAYRVREVKSGEVTYFNFELAKEMGLLSQEHPHLVTSGLKSKLLSTFSLQILNEYDELHSRRWQGQAIKKNKYMATRYLQLQHNDKRGKTSGDGRGIWNGVVHNQGKTWDVSSRGTGVTSLAPGAVEAQRPLKTGTTDFGYGCGLAELDELYGAAILAETLHLQGISTERILCIIDHGNGHGIGVRAAQNLLRPAHLFPYLKQQRLGELRHGLNYFIDRQMQNRPWPKQKQAIMSSYQILGERLCEDFARFTAQLDVNHIFVWLDWDGDNVLMDAGIIDYGSVRQFGCRHDHYRYDDVTRYSTNLNEQRHKSRLIVQTCVQMLDYATRGKKRRLEKFAHHPTVQAFDKHFQHYQTLFILQRLGFNRKQSQFLLQEKKLLARFLREFAYFEKAKISGPIKKVSDGINRPALFNLRPLLRTPFFWELSAQEVFALILGGFANRKDLQLRPSQRRHIEQFQKLYAELLQLVSDPDEVMTQAQQMNHPLRITGNALIQMVHELIKMRQQGMPVADLQKLMEQIIHTQIQAPQEKPALHSLHRPDVFQRLLNLIQDYRDDI